MSNKKPHNKTFIEDTTHKKLKSKTPFLDSIKEVQDSKNMDEIVEMILAIITAYGLKVNEVAAVNYYIMERTLKAKHNAELLKDKLKLDVNALGIEGILKVQEALTKIYIEELKNQK